MPTEPIITTGIIREILSTEAFRAELPNGKIIHAHLAKALDQRSAEIRVGIEVTLEMTPYDFDKGRISRINP